MSLDKPNIGRWWCKIRGRIYPQTSWVSLPLLVFVEIEWVQTTGEYVGPQGRLRACAWDADAVQGIQSVVESILSNIAIQVERRIRSGSVCQCSWHRYASEKDNRAICVRHAVRSTKVWLWVHKRLDAQWDRKSIYGRYIWLGYGRVSLAD